MLEMAVSYYCLGADQTMAIRIKSRERLILIPHALQILSHWEYAILVRNTWAIWCLKERGTKRDKIIRVNIYAFKIFSYSKEGYFQGPPLQPPFLG